MSEEDSVKNEMLYGSLKRQDDKPRRKRHCPFCGNELQSRVMGAFAFCGHCHRKMPWTVMKTDDKPVKPL